ncbi:MAG: hypothetical protein RQ760_15100 [Sedimentisphaerales bacterium]|nr:hypothetical protein [Sedimentisphaerales bacterium]
MKRNRLLISLYMYVVLAAVVGSSLEAALYRVDSQADFDFYKETEFRPGDTIAFKRGTVFNGMFSPGGSGTDKAPIYLKAYGEGHKPIINALGKNTAGIFLKNVEFWEIDGIEITNTDGTDEDQGTLFGIYVLAQNTGKTHHHIHINNCHIHDVNGKVAGKGRGGIHVHVEGEKPAKFHDLRIVGSRIERVGGVGIGNNSPHAKILFDNEAENNRKDYFWTKVYAAGNFIDYTGRNNIIARVSEDAVYEYNILANSSRYSTGHSIFCYNTKGIKIQYNEVYGNVGEGGKDRGAFDADYNCSHTYIQYNYSHDNHWFCGIMKRPTRYVYIRYNISQNDKKGIYFYGFEREQKADHVYIYNNTHYVSKELDVEVFCENRTPLNSVFENNIFYFEGAGRWGQNSKGINTRFNNNLYFNISPHESDWNPVVGDPRFEVPGTGGSRIDMRNREALLGYRLGPESPCIDSGSIIPENGGLDFWGNRITDGKPDIGAHEWSGMGQHK